VRDSQGQTRSEDEHPAFRRTTSALVAALFVAVGAAVSVAPAHADPVYDQKFIDYLDKEGVPYENRTEIIRVAKQFCLDTSRQGGSTWKAGYNRMKEEGWTETEATTFVQAAIATYCPGFGSDWQFRSPASALGCLLLFRYRCCAPDPRSRK
jgi:hypothetical protein